MNIIEAIKSGKKFRRPGTSWMMILDANDMIRLADDNGFKYLNSLSGTSICADDWEIEEEKIVITRSQLEAAIKKDYSTYDAFAKELGFKDET